MSNSHPTEEEWRHFYDDLQRLTPTQIANKRYSREWGTFDPTDSTKSDARVREANRYLSELKERRNLVPVTVGVWAAVVAVFIASLAMPLKDGVLAQTIGSEHAALQVMQVVLALFVIACAYLGWKSYVWMRGILDFVPPRSKRPDRQE